MSEKPLVDRQFLLEKYPGKGGWTYAAIPDIPQDSKNPFGWVKVRGKIDDHEFKHHKLMPMGEGQVFFSVNAKIRKAIGKEAGDWVRLVLYADTTHLEIPEEILACFKLEPSKSYDTFLSFTEGERKSYLDWIYDAKTEDTKVQRILSMMERLQAGKRLRDK